MQTHSKRILITFLKWKHSQFIQLNLCIITVATRYIYTPKIDIWDFDGYFFFKKKNKNPKQTRKDTSSNKGSVHCACVCFYAQRSYICFRTLYWTHFKYDLLFSCQNAIGQRPYLRDIGLEQDFKLHFGIFYKTKKTHFHDIKIGHPLNTQESSFGRGHILISHKFLLLE